MSINYEKLPAGFIKCQVIEFISWELDVIGLTRQTTHLCCCSSSNFTSMYSCICFAAYRTQHKQTTYNVWQFKECAD